MATLKLNCIISEDLPKHLFTIEISMDQNGSALRNKIRSANPNTFGKLDARTLDLYKVDIDIDQSKRMSISGVQHQPLLAHDQLSDVFVANNLSSAKIHIIVQTPQSGTGLCGPSDGELFLSPFTPPPHRVHLAHLDDCQELRKALLALNPDPAWYSNPQNMSTLPFPFLSRTLPVERFHFSPNNRVRVFHYIGREQFGRVWDNAMSLLQLTGRTRLSLSGTMGYGKSHILAALACLLARSGHHVVFLPDAREMLANKFSYLQTALLCAFTDPSLSSIRAGIRSCQTIDDLENFCYANGPLIFIVDQINALEEEDDRSDSITNAEKTELHQLLRRLSSHYTYITGASANHRAAQRMRQKQTNDLKNEMTGGMSEVSVSFVDDLCCQFISVTVRRKSSTGGHITATGYRYSMMKNGRRSNTSLDVFHCSSGHFLSWGMYLSTT